MTQNLKSIIGEYIADFKEKQNLPFVVKPSIPIVWFGDREKYEASPKKRPCHKFCVNGRGLIKAGNTPVK